MSQIIMGGRAWTAENKRAELIEGQRHLHVVPSSGSEPECGNVELLCVCDFRRKFVSPGQPVRGVHQDSQICDKNHKFATGLARIDAFCDEFSKIFT